MSVYYKHIASHDDFSWNKNDYIDIEIYDLYII